MPRPRTRTEEVNLDVVHAITNVFGTVQNAHRCLGLDGLVTYNQLVVALKFKSVQPREKEIIETAWERWKLLFLKPELPAAVTNDLAIQATWHENDPSWLTPFQTERPVAKKRKAG